MKLKQSITWICLGFIGSLLPAASGAVFTVSTPADLVSAVNSANASAGSHTINLLPGTYNLSAELPTIAVNKIITLQGTSSNPADTVLNQTAARTRFLETAFPASSINNVVLVIQNLTFRNGQGTDFGGGAILVGGIGSDTTVRNCVFVNNQTLTGSPAAIDAGGAIENSPNGNLTVLGCRFQNNSSVVNGGAIDYLNQSGGAGNLVVSNSVFISNTAPSDGGAIKAAAGPTGSITIVNCNFEGNTTTGTGRGGAIAHADGTINVNQNRFFNNSAAVHANGDTLFQPGGEPVLNATQNWWGQNSGPSGTDILAVGTVTANSWLQLRLAAGAASLGSGQSTTLTADLLGINLGGILGSGFLLGLPSLPDAPAAIFHNATLGNLSGASAQFAHGLASASFTAGAAKGIASAQATLDNQTLTVNITLPTAIASINRASPSPLNLSSVSWTVTFTDPVNGVGAGNFSLVNTGLGGTPAIASVTPVGAAPAAQWTVTASTGTGTGTLGLNMTSATGISAPLASVLPFAGQVYTIDLVPPTTTITAHPPVAANSTSATFSFTGADVGTGVAVFESSLDGGPFFTTTSPQTFGGLANGQHTFKVRAIDNAGNVDANPPSFIWSISTAPLTIAISAPSVSTTAAGPVQYTVTYGGPNFASSTLAPADITLNTTETATGTVGVSGSGNTRIVTISSITGHGTLGISIAAGTATDTFGTFAPAAGPSATFIVNHPPVAGPVTIQRYPTQTTKVLAATLLASANDADGDTLTLDSVQSPTPAGSTVTRLGAWVLFKPAAGLTTLDTFTYTVNDTRGGSSTGTVTVAIIVDNASSSNLAAITNLGGGVVQITFHGIPGSTYTIQFSLSPSGPWSTLGTATTDATGLGSINDPTGSTTKFYRTVFP